MASPAFLRHANAFRLLSLRSDIDDIILEILGKFSLEKIYSEADTKTYQTLVVALLAQLNSIFSVQRLTLPSENLQIGWYLGFLASWEVTLRAVEFVLQVVIDGRETLWGARALREKYLAEFLAGAIRFLTLHPKIPANQKVKDRRERFARIHRQLERVFDSYPASESFLLLACREITDSLRTEPNGLALPQRLKSELPNLATELYPLSECLCSQYVSTLVPPDSLPGDWLPQFLALRDIANFVVGASLQYMVNRETRDVRLQSSSARTRTAVLQALNNLRMPAHLSKHDLIATFTDTFRIILPDTLHLSRDNSQEPDEAELDAIDALCARLNDRQIIHRVSDREMMHSITKITRNIALLDDPSGQFRATRPRLYALNCHNCHLVGNSQLRSAENISFTLDNREGSEVINLPAKSRCILCRDPVTIAREISVGRNVWDILKPLESNSDTINVERHLPTQFHLVPPKSETDVSFHSDYSNIHATQRYDLENSPPIGRSMFSGTTSPDRTRSMPQDLVYPNSPGIRRGPDTPTTEIAYSEDFTAAERSYVIDTPISGTIPKSLGTLGESIVASDTAIRSPVQSRLHSFSTTSTEQVSVPRRGTVPLVISSEKGMSRWKSKLSGPKKETIKTSGESSSISSTTLETQRLEEISLKSLINGQKVSMRGKTAKNVNISLSQNSTYALFWAQSSISIWDIGTPEPILGKSISVESLVVLAAVTKMHLAYVIGTRDQKLTLRIVNLPKASAPVIEYRMPSLPWCHSICICPMENYVVVGFDDSTVRFFKTSKTENPRIDRLHARYHIDCRNCPTVDTLSFSDDGLSLVASTRSQKSGTIQLYSWQFPFEEFHELTNCRYSVPLHESEDNGVSSAIFRAGNGGEEDLACITTWTQSGVPVLIQPSDGHKSEIKTEISGHHGKLGNRIQCASFSPTGKELAMVNDKGNLYLISNLNSSPIEIRKIATSKEFTVKSDSFAMAFMTLADEEGAIVLAWTDTSKCVAHIKKVPVSFNGDIMIPITPLAPAPLKITPRYELPSDGREIPRPPVELSVPEDLSSLHLSKVKR